MSKDWSICFKGVALILMLVFHLWNPFVDMGYETIGIFHQEWAAFGSICVSIFVFLAGYGLVVSNSCTTICNTFKRAKKLYLNFWKVWIIATPVILLLGVASFDIKRIILEFSGANPSYNKMFWFIYLYVELVCFYFLYRKIEFKYKDYCFVIGSLIIGIISSILNLFTLLQISRFLESLPCFLMGVAFAKGNLFSKIPCKRMGETVRKL